MKFLKFKPKNNLQKIHWIKKMEVSNVIILPGNGCYDVTDSNWYFNLEQDLKKLKYKVMLKNMPDPFVAREIYWIPFIEKDLQANENSIIIGHSSGAVAAMRYAETHKVKAIFLVSACWTDLGIENEKNSGYYSRDWEWEKIKKNCEKIVQLHSKNDPFIPMEESDHIHKNLNSEYYVFEKLGHFMFEDFPQLVEIFKKTIQ
jgi:uncharacterized protein